MTDSTGEPEVRAAVERVWPAIDAWHRGGLGMHTNDGRWLQKRIAEKKAATDAIRAELEAAYARGLTKGLEDAIAAYANTTSGGGGTPPRKLNPMGFPEEQVP